MNPSSGAVSCALGHLRGSTPSHGPHALTPLEVPVAEHLSTQPVSSWCYMKECKACTVGDVCTCNCHRPKR